MQAHREGKLHRAISVFIFNSKGELLLQQRAARKYHSSLLWTNTCCSHPYPGETTIDAANRRLRQEMGMSCPLTEAFSFIYRAELDNNLTEHELDHVFVGQCDDVPVLNTEEAESWKYSSIPDLEKEIAAHPGQFTEWFKICFHEWHNHLFNKK